MVQLDSRFPGFMVSYNISVILSHWLTRFSSRYGWRYQIGPWVKRGWRVIVPDTLGYGGTSKPTELSKYSTRSICRELIELLDFNDVHHKVVVVGHDWGSEIAWRFCLWHPERVRMVVGSVALSHSSRMELIVITTD